MSKAKYREVELPQEIENIANDLSNILSNTINNTLNQNKKEEEKTELESWLDLINSSFSQDIDKWSSKDFVHWFTYKLYSQLNIPYIIEYSRDCSSIRKIKDQLTVIGKKDNKIIRDFISWSVDNYDRLKEEEGKFNLPILNKFLNEFLQNNKDEKEESRSLGFNIINNMKKEVSINPKNSMISLLVKFGIPLTVEFYYYHNYDLDNIITGIHKRLKYFENNNVDKLQSIAQNSLDFSPYPDWFKVKDWRQKYNDIFSNENFNKLKGWRDTDYSGNFAIEYNNFLKEK